MNDICGNEINILPMSDRNVRCVDKGDTIVFGALTYSGLAELTLMAENKEYPDKQIEKTWKLADGTVHMIEFRKIDKKREGGLSAF